MVGSLSGSYASPVTMGATAAAGTPTTGQRLGYRPDLDGLRAVAVLAVFAAHTPFTMFVGGGAGVDIFFVLSGFLITTLLLNERAATGTVSFRRFYARRALRLYPALIVMVALALAATVAVGWSVTGYGKEAGSSLLYLSDFTVGYRWVPLGALAHTWSLAVEEQFYLLWPPVLLWFLTRRRNPVPWVVAAVVGGTVALALGSLSWDGPGHLAVYSMPWARFPNLLLGCLLAMWLDRRPAPSWVRGNTSGLVVAAALLVTFELRKLSSVPNLGWQVPMAGAVTVAVLLHLHAGRSWLRTVLAWRPLVAVGKRSYGVYLFHNQALFFLGAAHLGRVPATLAALAVTGAITWASYRFVERPFLRVKERYRSTEVAPAIAATGAVTGLDDEEVVPA